MIVNHSHRFIFYHVPKAAGSSIRSALLSVPGSKKPFGSKHMTPREYLAGLNWFQRRRVRDYFTFCFVRDPFERFGSAHRFMLNRMFEKNLACTADVNDFALMLANRLDLVSWAKSIKPQTEYADHVSFIGRYENLSEDFVTICKTIGIRAELPYVNQSGPQGRYIDIFNKKQWIF